MNKYKQICINAYKVSVEQILAKCDGKVLGRSVLQRIISYEPKICGVMLGCEAAIACPLLLTKSKSRIQWLNVECHNE